MDLIVYVRLLARNGRKIINHQVIASSACSFPAIVPGAKHAGVNAASAPNVLLPPLHCVMQFDRNDMQTKSVILSALK
jgi:hypothetical protein